MRRRRRWRRWAWRARLAERRRILLRLGVVILVARPPFSSPLIIPSVFAFSVGMFHFRLIVGMAPTPISVPVPITIAITVPIPAGVSIAMATIAFSALISTPVPIAPSITRRTRRRTVPPPLSLLVATSTAAFSEIVSQLLLFSRAPPQPLGLSLRPSFPLRKFCLSLEPFPFFFLGFPDGLLAFNLCVHECTGSFLAAPPL
jgi:hypothetical protein